MLQYLLDTALTALLFSSDILRLSSQRTPEAAICPLSKERAQNSSRGPLHPSKTNFEFQFNSSLFFTNLRPSTRLPFWTRDMPLSAVGMLRMLAPAPDPTGRYWRPVLCVSMSASAIATDLQWREANRLGMRTRMRGLRSRQRDRAHAPESQGRSGMHALPAWREEKREDKKPGGRFRNFFGCFGTFWRTPRF